MLGYLGRQSHMEPVKPSAVLVTTVSLAASLLINCPEVHFSTSLAFGVPHKVPSLFRDHVYPFPLERPACHPSWSSTILGLVTLGFPLPFEEYYF